MFFKQIKQFSDNFSYVVADDATGDAAVVDSSYNVDEITRMLKAKNLHLKSIINTHGHSDHTDGNDELRSTFRAKIVAH
jgi:hydroxyacylglutathione hydrolase